MRTVLLHDADLVATFDDASRELRGGWVLLRGPAVEALGEAGTPLPEADERIDCRGMVLTPGLINTHHHFFQTLTRAVPGTQDAGLFEWLTRLYPVWARLTPEAVRISTQTALLSLLRSGCTTASDHGYIWPNGARIDDQIEAAKEIGVRFHASRGSMSLGESDGGLPPDRLVERESAILEDCARAVERYHDRQRFAMTRIVLAPCSPFSVSLELMRESAEMARRYGVHLHTHLAETRDEERYCLERFGCRPIELAERCDWAGEDVWYAHGVHLDRDEIARIGARKTGVAHCPSSNMRLASGIAPVAALRAAGARVGLGVDGSASNDASHLLAEARQAMLLARVAGDAGALSARAALELATRGGAAVLGRDDVGFLAPGMAADVAGWRVDGLTHAGAAVHDPLAALVFCEPAGADLVIVNGRVRVRDGAFAGIDADAIVRAHNAIARSLFC